MSSSQLFFLERTIASNLPSRDIQIGFALSVFIAIVGTICNVFTLISIGRSKKLRAQSTTVFVISLTISDLLYCMFCLPLTAETFHECYLCRIPVACSAYAFIFYWNISVMMFNQAALSFNRFIIVCYLPESQIRFTSSKNCIILILVWVFPFVALLIPVTGLWGSMGFDRGTGTCTMIDPKAGGGSPRKTFLISGLIVPIFIIIYCYFRIYLAVERSKKLMKTHRSNNLCLNASSVGLTSSNTFDNRRTSIKIRQSASSDVSTMSRQRKEGRVSLTLFVIFISFIICTAPPAIVLALDPGAKLYPAWHIPLYAFGWCFGLVNPAIYLIFNSSYRQAYLQTYKDMKKLFKGF